jgi:hypothetical protein
MGEPKLPDIATPDNWRAEIDKLRIKEKELTRAHDAVNALRRRLPMVKIDKQYEFDGVEGNACLLDLFSGRRQLIVYHFMFDPDWEAGCPGCSWVTDAMSHPAHLHARDTSLVLISRAPLISCSHFENRWDGISHGIHRLRVISILTLTQPTTKASTTSRACSFATERMSIAPTSPIGVAWNILAATGHTSILPRLVGRNRGKTPRQAGRKKTITRLDDIMNIPPDVRNAEVGSSILLGSTRIPAGQ